MFNKKGKDILVWINCVVFIIVIGLSTFKGTLKEGTIEKFDIDLDAKASGQAAEASDPEVPDSCTTDKQKKIAKDFYSYFEKMGKKMEGEPYYNWKERHELRKMQKELEIYKRFGEIDKKKYPNKIISNHYEVLPRRRHYVDKRSQENIAHMVCGGDPKKLPYKDYVKKKRRKLKCEFQGKGIWDSKTERCGCIGGIDRLKGIDNVNEKELTDKGKKNKKFNKKHIVDCYCAPDSKGREYYWEIDDNDSSIGTCKPIK